MWDRVLGAADVQDVATCQASLPTGYLLRMGANNGAKFGQVTSSDFACSKC